ncbi:MAG TPA: BatA domain-containing protein, partial [Rhizomicrobium sp.]|nr:BatA domain-containing protein [Rhizomicrobium sp.]
MSFLPAISFGAPWILATLAVLPVIYWLLRVTPPAPRRIVFPPTRLLADLAAPEETPARTPPWLLALRLAVAGLIIVALAQPLLGETLALPGKGPLILFIDNGWTAAHDWSSRVAAITDALNSAVHANRAVAIVPAASPAPDAATLLSAGEAERRAA